MKKLIGSSLVAITAALSFSSSASAADVQGTQPVVQEAQSPWQIRVRALGVVPRDKGHVSQIPDSGMDFSSTVIPELDITYYFTNNIAAELILGTTYSSIDGSGSLSAAGAGKLGKTWILPPTLTLQYHFTNFGNFKPYVGAGVNYTIFYNTDAGKNSAGIGMSDLNIDNTWGAAVQVGFDYMLDQHWGFNFDVKKLYLRPDWDGKLNAATAGALGLDRHVSGEAKLDPWLIGAGVTYRF
ncbi:OmpW/AlkL family protein [Bartonella sp. LJL80]